MYIKTFMIDDEPSWLTDIWIEYITSQYNLFDEYLKNEYGKYILQWVFESPIQTIVFHSENHYLAFLLEHA